VSILAKSNLCSQGIMSRSEERGVHRRVAYGFIGHDVVRPRPVLSGAAATCSCPDQAGPGRSVSGRRDRMPGARRTTGRLLQPRHQGVTAGSACGRCRGRRARQPPRPWGFRPKDASEAAAPWTARPRRPQPPTAGHPGRPSPGTWPVVPARLDWGSCDTWLQTGHGGN